MQGSMYQSLGPGPDIVMMDPFQGLPIYGCYLRKDPLDFSVLSQAHDHVG